MATQTGYIIRGETIREVLENARDAVRKNGQQMITPHGEMQVLPAATLVLTNIQDQSGSSRPEDRYPHWEKPDETWYLRTFVRPELGPPEDSQHDIVFPFTYAWRTRFHDQGWGHVLKLILQLQNFNYTEAPFTRKEDIDQLVRETYRQFHPDLTLAILYWLGKTNLQDFLIEPERLKKLLNAHRQDLLKQLGEQLGPDQSTPSISTSYAHIDLANILEKTPVYQSIQIVPTFDRQQNAVGFELYHIHHHLYADTVSQLEFAHDLDWGNELTKLTGLPMSRITIFTPHLYLYRDSQFDKPDAQHDIRRYLMSNTSGYEPEKLDIDKFVELENYINKVKLVLERLG